MLDWIYNSPFEDPAAIARWGTLLVCSATLIVLALTIEFRLRRNMADRRLARLSERWLDLMAGAAASDEAARLLPLPRIARADKEPLMRLWIEMRSNVEGAAATRLKVLADRLSLQAFARKCLRRRSLSTRLLGLHCLGHFGDKATWAWVEPELNSENTAVSISAAAALASIDPERGIERIVAMLTDRRDWPRTQVMQILHAAGAECIGEPLYRKIRSATDEEAAFLLPFARLAEYEVRDTLAAEILRSRSNPELLSAALKTVSGLTRVPRLDTMACHNAWHVRMQAAGALGRVGAESGLPLLKRLLADPEWWVRYRAAQSIVSLPFLDGEKIRELQQQQSDPFANAMLDQALAEAIAA